MEYADIDDLLAFKSDQKKEKMESGQTVRNPFKVMGIEGCHSNFQRPIIIEDTTESNSFYLCGGAQLKSNEGRSQRGQKKTQRIHKLSIEFSLRETESTSSQDNMKYLPTSAKLNEMSESISIDESNAFSQTLLQNRYYNDLLKEWAFLDENGILHLLNQEATKSSSINTKNYV